MRTRSQPDSPGGFVSLDDNKRATRRTTRSTRSASGAASQEPTSEQPAEPTTQPATRSKTQARTTKKSTTRKATSTTTTTKPQTRKGSRRGTRSATRKAEHNATEEAQENIEKNTHDPTRTDNKENVDVGTENIESRPLASDSALMEPKNSERNAMASTTLNKSKFDKKLIKKKVNRKRPHTEDSPDDNSEPVTPQANKRRNLGPPGSTPFARRTTRLTPLRRLPHTVSFSERKRRREAESQGRIHSTIFRLPQYVAQTEADRRASETAALTSLSNEPLQADFDFSSEPAPTNDQTAAQEPSTQELFTPEPARSSWNLSGLINSVPRSFSRLLPRFGRSRSTTEAQASQEPASVRIQRTQQAVAFPAAAPEQEPQHRRRLSEQPPAKRARNLSYSLFPAPIDRSRYLGDIPPKPTATSVTTPASESTAQPVEERAPSRTENQEPPTSTERGRETTPQESNAASKSKKKRKRSPSPDVIPNPAGSSYGMDLDYFCYSSESEGEAEPSPPESELDHRGKTALRNIAQSERPASKKVRFEASPEDTPSKRRARATDPYRGRHFIGIGGPQTSSAPTTPTPEPRVAESRQQPGFILNKSGTFQLDYDALSDDSDTDNETVSSPKLPTLGAVRTPTPAQNDSSQSSQSPASRSAARSTQPPSTPAPKIDEEALARARSQAEKYKPKTPSGLRTASRYSSPLTAITPELTPAPAPPAEKVTEKFGDDEFAKDAQWLYSICPSGDLNQLVWPEKKPFGEDLIISAEALRIVNEIWDSAEVDEAYVTFRRELAEFKKAAV
ncbi:hypothetical protein BDW72DRAFT_205880 [Aspergillus terricola var. indicus]